MRHERLDEGQPGSLDPGETVGGIAPRDLLCVTRALHAPQDEKRAEERARECFRNGFQLGSSVMSDDTITLTYLTDLFRRHLLTLAVTFVTCLGLAAFAAQKVPKKYKATTLLQIQSSYF